MPRASHRRRSIKQFYIEVDLDGRDLLYDYCREQYVDRPPSGRWDLRALNSRDDYLDVEDKNVYVRAGLMDKTIRDKRIWDRKPKTVDEGVYRMLDENERSQAIPGRLLPVFKPGEEVEGKLIIETTEVIPTKHVHLYFNGRAVVNVRVYGRCGYRDWLGTEDYTKHRTILKLDKEDPDADQEINYSLLEGPAIQPGYHKFRFRFEIPGDAPSSISQLLKSYSDYAYLSYRIKAKINMGKCFKVGNLVIHRGIWVQRPWDIAAVPANLQSLTKEKSRHSNLVGMHTGVVTCRATITRRAFVRGEVVPLILDIDNFSTSDIKSVSARVILSGSIYTTDLKLRAERDIIIRGKKMSNCGAPIGPGTQVKYTWDVPIDFSETILDSKLAPVGRLNDCHLIDIGYALRVKVIRNRAHANLVLNLPIQLGTHCNSVG